jgi:molybdopterin converting factor small subunit
MKVAIPSPLLSYTKQQGLVEAEGATLVALLEDLECRFPGIRFRMIDEQEAIRPHIRIFRNGRQVRDVDTPLESSDEIQIIQALSGG